MAVVVFVAGLVATTAACGDNVTSLGSNPNDLLCEIAAPTACPEPSPRYAEVAPIFAERCASCHLGAEGGPWALNDYGNVADWVDVVRADLLSCTMPPPDSGVPMTDGERLLILQWIRCGYPE